MPSIYLLLPANESNDLIEGPVGPYGEKGVAGGDGLKGVKGGSGPPGNHIL